MRPTGRRRSRDVAGRTLVELSIAIALGLALLAAFLAVYLASRASARVAQLAGSAEDTVRFAMVSVGSAIKGAGYGEIVGSDFTADRQTLFDGPAVRGCTESRFSDAFHPTAPDYRCVGQAPGDQVLVRFQGRYALVPMDAAALARSALPDCLGASNAFQDASITPAAARPGGGLQRRMVQSAFALDAAGGVLRCHGNGNPATPAPIANDVVDFRVFYRFDDAGFALAAGNDINVAPVGASVRTSAWIDAAGGSAVDPWRHVVAVIVCITVAAREGGTTLRGAATRSARCPRSAAEAESGVLPTELPPDGRLRQTVIETFTVRSQATGALFAAQ